MALSAQTYIGDGVTQEFVLSFALGYIATAHIYVYVDGNEVPQNTLTFTQSGTLVRTPTIPVVGAKVLVRRIMPNSELIHDFSNGALVLEKSLDEGNMQAIMLQHEAIDGFLSTGQGADLNMGGHGITNLRDAVNDGDAVPFLQVKQYEDAVKLTGQQLETSLTNVHNQAVADINQGISDVNAIKADFDAKYQGAVSSLPDATTLSVGTMAFLIGVGMKVVRQGTPQFWGEAGSVIELVEDTLFATNVAGQTQFDIEHNLNMAHVHYNGRKLPRTEYQSFGTHILLTSPVAHALDTIDITAWGNTSTFNNNGLTQKIEDVKNQRAKVGLNQAWGQSYSGTAGVWQTLPFNHTAHNKNDILTLNPDGSIEIKATGWYKTTLRQGQYRANRSILRVSYASDTKYYVGSFTSTSAATSTTDLIVEEVYLSIGDTVTVEKNSEAVSSGNFWGINARDVGAVGYVEGCSMLFERLGD